MLTRTNTSQRKQCMTAHHWQFLLAEQPPLRTQSMQTDRDAFCRCSALASLQQTRFPPSGASPYGLSQSGSGRGVFLELPLLPGLQQRTQNPGGGGGLSAEAACTYESPASVRLRLCQHSLAACLPFGRADASRLPPPSSATSFMSAPRMSCMGRSRERDWVVRFAPGLRICQHQPPFQANGTTLPGT